MNSKPFFILAYHVFFVLLSMGIVTIIESDGREMYIAAYYFNWIYFITGGLFHYLFYLILQPFYFRNPKKLLAIHFFACILLMNIFSFFLDDNWITLTFIKGIFIKEKQGFWAALIIHFIIPSCYVLAFVVTRRSMQLTASRLFKKQASSRVSIFKTQPSPWAGIMSPNEP